LLSLASNAVPTLGWGDTLGRLAVAAALGSVIGFEREFREREAGLRTHLLVSVGAALFTIVSAYGFRDILGASGPSVLVRLDPSRIAAQIVSGIGFLGAGAIIRQGLSVRGLTTAASLWVVAAIGMAAGSGFYAGAVLATALGLIALWPVRVLAYRVIERIRPEENLLTVELKEGQPVGPFIAQLDDVRHFELSDERDRRVIQLELPHIDEDLVARLSDLDYVIGIRWRR
jgi:putative Mg2+ transporter-C (MgtC) family protein